MFLQTLLSYLYWFDFYIQLNDFYVDVGAADSDISDGTNTGFLITEGGEEAEEVRLPITAEVAATINPLASVVLRYRLMFEDEAELAVLGSMLSTKEAVSKSIQWLKPEHFYKEAHNKIFYQ